MNDARFIVYYIAAAAAVLLFHGKVPGEEEIFWAENNFVTQKTRDEFRISAGQRSIAAYFDDAQKRENGSRWIISWLLYIF